MRKHAVLYPVNTHKLLLFFFFFSPSQTVGLLNKNIRKGIVNYYDDLDFKNIMDFVQKRVSFCPCFPLSDKIEWSKWVFQICTAKQNTCLTRQDSSQGLKWSWIIIASYVGCTVAQRNKEAACSKIHLLTEEERQVVRHFAFSVMPHRVRRCLAWPVPMEQDCVSTEWYFGCLRAQQLVNVVWKVIWLFSKHLPRFASLHNGTVQLFNDWLPSRKIVLDYFHHPPETHLFLQFLSACLFCTRVQ